MAASDIYRDAVPYIDTIGSAVLNAWIPGLGAIAQPISQGLHDWAFDEDPEWLTGPGAMRQNSAGAGAAGPSFGDVDINSGARIDRFDFGQYLADAAARDSALAGRQDSFLDSLTARAEGRTPSLAEMQLQSSLAQNQANAAGFMASQRGMNPALAARNVLGQQAGMAQQTAGQGAMLRAQEQLAAEQALGQALQGFRGQDQNMFGMSSQGQQGQNQLSAQMGNADRDARLRLAELQSADAARREEAAARRREENRSILGGGLDSLGKLFSASGAMGGGGGASDVPAMNAPVSAPYSGMADGGEVPGRAEVKGDSPKNDKVLALLSPGEVVVPRSVVDDDDPGEAAKAFVEACRAKKGK